MYIIGLTGGIASGKSTVSGMLRDFGAYIIDADKIAKEIVRPGLPAWKEMVKAFGTQILHADNNLNRQAVADIVFNDASALAELNNITHPAVYNELLLKMEQAKNEGIKVTVLDVPLLIEKNWQGLAAAVWLVYVDRDTQMQRLMQRNQLSHQDAVSRIDAQMSLEVKKSYATVIIDNRGSLDETYKQVLSAWESIP